VEKDATGHQPFAQARHHTGRVKALTPRRFGHQEESDRSSDKVGVISSIRGERLDGMGRFHGLWHLDGRSVHRVSRETEETNEHPESLAARRYSGQKVVKPFDQPSLTTHRPVQRR
jgi:hypothetical protein